MYLKSSHRKKEKTDVKVLQITCLSSQFSSLLLPSCPTHRDPMDCSAPGLPVHQQLPELTQTHVHQVRDETPWTAARQASLSINNSQSSLRLMSIKSMMPSNHPILIVPFSSYLQSFPASGSFQMIPFFASGGQSIEVSALASVLPMNIQDWFPLGWTG